MNILNESPLELGEVIDLNKGYKACFDGRIVVVWDPDGQEVLQITPAMMAHLFWLNRRIQRTFPRSFVVDLSEDE